MHDVGDPSRFAICAKQQVLAVVERKTIAYDGSRASAERRSGLAERYVVTSNSELDGCCTSSETAADHRNTSVEQARRLNVPARRSSHDAVHGRPYTRHAAREAIHNLRSGVSAMRWSSTL